jgi:GlcNAc-P-P-Und epimerase
MAACGKTFPLTSSRFKNMISDYLTPMEKTFETFGDPSYSLVQGVEASVEWLKRVVGA